ncbi:MAG TPA: M13 family metallopeptidase [Candidatus Saccharimonadales bacterium]|nr:M13 family metallopeptidase [Candidatus Saccharimonadales bacterium]
MSLKSEISPKIRPGDDFYNYVNKRWIDAHPMPADKASFGALRILTDENLAKLQKLLTQKIRPSDSISIKVVKQYYQSAMDETGIAKATPKFVQNILDQIAAINDTGDVKTYIAQSHAQNMEMIWGVIIEPDDKNSRRYLTRFWQGGLGLPDRTYYLEKSKDFETIRQQYMDYLAKFFELVGLDQASKRAEHIYKIEKALAAASLSRADCRNPKLVYHPHTIKQLTSRYPNLDWHEYLPAVGLKSVQVLNVSQPKFLTEVNRLLKQTPIDHWRDYFIIHTIEAFATKLSKPYEDLVFNFHDKILTGQQKIEPRAVRMTRHTMNVLPEPIGRLFVEHYFNKAAKQAVGDLVDHLLKAFAARIDRLEWMSPATKRQAHKKLSTFLPLLGYPDKWRSYSGLKLGSDFAANFLAIAQFDWQFQVSRINKPVDRKEWHMSPALVNAYYWANTNGITFPAGILQPPFFYASGDFAANYGGIGAVIGHEITHGFDDQGSQFDAHGNMKGWWQTSDQANFEKRAKSLVKSYSAYKINGRAVDGQLTLGENIADLGGLIIAFEAMQAKLTELGNSNRVDGFTPEQRFFISFACTWRYNYRPELMLKRLVSDPHSPEVYRVNGTLVNVDAFYEAFDVGSKDKLYLDPAKRVRIW